MPLHPQAKAFLAGTEASGPPPLHELSPEEARAATGMITELVGAGPRVATVKDFTIATTAGEIGGRRYEPDVCEHRQVDRVLVREGAAVERDDPVLDETGARIQVAEKSPSGVTPRGGTPLVDRAAGRRN